MRMSGPKQSGTFYLKRKMAVQKLANRKPLSKKQREKRAWKDTVAKGRMHEDSYLPG